MTSGDYSEAKTEMRSPSSDREAPNTSSVDGDHVELPEHPGALQKAEMLSEEEVKGTLEAVASTGKFWQDWEKLKGMLSWWLKKVLSEYPEAKMTDEQQKEALGETYPELVRRLDEALLSFDEGPPFTLQRLCEILLAARSIYPKLSKLALALEKNLLVTSMLSISTDPQLQTTEEANAATEDPKTAAANGTHPNGIEDAGCDKDEIMTEVEEEEEEADVDDAMTIDMETIDEPSETLTTFCCRTIIGFNGCRGRRFTVALKRMPQRDKSLNMIEALKPEIEYNVCSEIRDILGSDFSVFFL